MCKCGRIDHDAGRNFSCLVNPVDDLVFAVRLVKAKFKSVLSGDLAAIGLDISKSFVAVDVRLAFAKEIKVGTVQYVDEVVHGDSDASISSIRMFRNTCGNVTMARSSDQPDEMKWDRMPGSIEYDDVGHPLLMGFGHRRCELHSGGSNYQHRLSADSLGNGAYQIRNRLVVDMHGQARNRRAIDEHLEPIREQ